MLPPLKEVIRKYQLSTKQSLGQNFILDQQLTDKIVKQAGLSEGVTVIEIGPGPGGLSRSILNVDCVTTYYAIEMDQRCYPLLHELFEFYDKPCHLIEGDALEVNLAELGPAPRAVLANLPYNVSTIILIQLLKQIVAFESLTLMFQKEVAMRLVAKPNTKEYGRLSVMAQWVSEISLCFDISPKAFVPQPKVTSTVVKFKPRENISAEFLSQYWSKMEYVVGLAFQQRRKMLRQSLKTYLGQEVEQKLGSIGIDPTLRAENLSIEDFFKLSQL